MIQMCFVQKMRTLGKGEYYVQEMHILQRGKYCAILVKLTIVIKKEVS